MGDEPGRGWGIHRERNGEGRVCSREKEEIGVRLVNTATRYHVPFTRGRCQLYGVEIDNV